MILKIVQVGEPVLRQVARPLSEAEIRSAEIRRLIGLMWETMRDAPGVGLAAPQVGEPIQLLVIEDREEYQRILAPERLAEREREPVPFHVLANPIIMSTDESARLFFEGCLSLPGFVALTERHAAVRVSGLNEHAEPVTIEARGWYARILQHETDHLQGHLYVDRMLSRSFMHESQYRRHWQEHSVSELCAALGLEATGC
ncbi:MAG: peptide deformylase [Chloroflexi bacterium]|nr:peptide deformylase [Chloroflexota bacterium]